MMPLVYAAVSLSLASSSRFSMSVGSIRLVIVRFLIGLNISFRKPDMNPRDKCKLFAATVESVLAYGTETWRMSKTLEATLDRNKFLRSAFNIKRNEFVTNERSFELTQCEKLTGKVRSKRIQFAGHCFERTNEKISKNSYRKPIQGKTEVFHVFF